MTSLTQSPSLTQLLQDSITVRHPAMQALSQAIFDALCAHVVVPSDPIELASLEMQEDCQRAGLLVVRYLDPRWRARAFAAAERHLESHWHDTPGQRRQGRIALDAAVWAFLHELDGQAPEQGGCHDE